MRVLVVRFSAVGDCIMTAWPVTAVRTARPDDDLVWAVQERCAPVIDTDRLVNSLMVVPRERWKSSRWSPQTWREQLAAYASLRKTRIDVGLDFQGHSKTAVLLRLSGAGRRFSSRATDALAARLTPPESLSPTGPHEVELGYALVRAVFQVPEVERPIMPDCGAAPLALGTRVVSIQTGAGHLDKLYPVAHWVAVASRLISEGFEVVAVGGPGDPRLEAPGVHDLVGQLTLRQTLAIVRGSALHLAADTGTGHAAAAFGVPVVSVFGPTDPARYRPWSQEAVVLREPSTSDVEPDQVVETALGLLRRARCACPD